MCGAAESQALRLNYCDCDTYRQGPFSLVAATTLPLVWSAPLLKCHVSSRPRSTPGYFVRKGFPMGLVFLNLVSQGLFSIFWLPACTATPSLRTLLWIWYDCVSCRLSLKPLAYLVQFAEHCLRSPVSVRTVSYGRLQLQSSVFL